MHLARPVMSSRASVMPSAKTGENERILKPLWAATAIMDQPINQSFN